MDAEGAGIFVLAPFGAIVPFMISTQMGFLDALFEAVSAVSVGVAPPSLDTSAGRTSSDSICESTSPRWSAPAIDPRAARLSAKWPTGAINP